MLADKGYPSKANRAWLRERGIAATIPERDDQIAHRRMRRGRPIDFGNQQRVRYRGRNVVDRCFNKLKQWRGIAMGSDKTARNYHAGLCLAATAPLAHQQRSSSIDVDCFTLARPLQSRQVVSPPLFVFRRQRVRSPSAGES